MSFAGFSKDDQIADVIAYLKTFDAAGNPVAGDAFAIVQPGVG